MYLIDSTFNHHSQDSFFSLSLGYRSRTDKRIALAILSISSLSALLLFIIVSAFIIYCQNLTTESDLESSNNQENRNETNTLLNKNELRRDSLSLGSVMTAVKANEFY